MIARPELKRVPRAAVGPRTGLTPRLSLARRLGFRLRITFATLVAHLARPAEDPTRFSPDAWNAWDEHGTL